MGGMIGQTAALKDPSRFLSLSLCDTSSRVPGEGQALWSERMEAARSQGMEALRRLHHRPLVLAHVPD